jgi:hypothetical protein
MLGDSTVLTPVACGLLSLTVKSERSFSLQKYVTQNVQHLSL